MQPPIIGLTTYNTENQGKHPFASLAHRYIAAVQDTGGIPVLIPSILDETQLMALSTKLDGILFTGGGDISVDRYGGDLNHRLIDVDEGRDGMELFLLQKSIKEEKPFLGICRGIQVVNVALGGTLYSDIEDQYPNALKHNYDSYTQRNFLAHSVRIDGDSKLAEILGQKPLRVNSLHHQGLKNIASSLRAVAWSEDGLVEAVEVPDHTFGFAVQWHPEWLTDQPEARELFRAFVMACSQHKSNEH
jgi:putative glutamine amidotransferase